MTAFRPSPRASSQSVIAALASAVGRPSRRISGLRELTATPGSVSAASSGAEASSAVAGDDADDRQAEGRRELEVALVVAGDGHDRAGAVAHQDVVGDPDRDPLRR